MLPNKKPLKFGLNISKQPPQKPTTSRNIFGDDEIEENKGEVQLVNQDIKKLAIEAQNSKKNFDLIKGALEEDANAYDYDEVYDQMKQSQKAAIEAMKGTSSKKPRYIDGLLKTAELRKRDRLRAEEKMVEKEREREGEQFADKEKFVTQAYKLQQEELKRLEEQDNQKGSDNKFGALSGLYRTILNSHEKVHEAAIIKERKLTPSGPAKPIEKEENELDSIDPGKDVELNDDNEVIDRRQLLSAGLNITKKRKTVNEVEDSTLSAYDEFVQRRAREQQNQKEIRAEAQRRRLTQQLQAQLKEKEIETEQEQEKKKEELAIKMARRNNNEAVQDARARYLARKKEMQKSES
ncbi:hypothetical protein DSO57_1025428 [Entomophthora muscae]|uniref:Uncharacterized protein n=1 Tax=Entomophthora muscae TaxID=34485 RepID=A0ACC2SRM9_9FUNG|nr:hypothetical protein DSO57_1025428 [Entomophthora muscae]